ncbi:MAG: hypothetical protein ACLFOY_18460 [Desulfatibacillaceae bacterium]
MNRDGEIGDIGGERVPRARGDEPAIDSGKKKGQVLAAVVRNGFIEAWTFIPTNRMGYVNKQRKGVLAWAREVEGEIEG